MYTLTFYSLHLPTKMNLTIGFDPVYPKHWQKVHDEHSYTRQQNCKASKKSSPQQMTIEIFDAREFTCI